MTADQFVKAQLAAFAYSEAFKCGGHESMLAVCYVLRNRVRAGWHGGDWQGVLNNTEAAAAFPEGKRPQIELSSETFRRVLMEIDDIYLGTATDKMSEKGLYYCDALPYERAMRPWFREKIMGDPSNHPRVAQVGMLHIFR